MRLFFAESGNQYLPIKIPERSGSASILINTLEGFYNIGQSDPKISFKMTLLHTSLEPFFDPVCANGR